MPRCGETARCMPRRPVNAPPQPVTDRMPAERQRLALEGFFEIMQRWGVDSGTARWILGAPPERTFSEWKRGKVGRVPEDTLRRIGCVAGIWKALEILYSDPDLADGWVKRPNAGFWRCHAARAHGGRQCDRPRGRAGLCRCRPGAVVLRSPRQLLRGGRLISGRCGPGSFSGRGAMAGRKPCCRG